jgi:hypothetical protein
MKSAAEFFEIFRRHGFLTSAVHVAQDAAGTTTAVDVAWSAPGEVVLDDITAKRYAITLPLSLLPSLQAGDRFVIDGRTYSARSVMPKPGTDGSEWIVELARLD